MGSSANTILCEGTGEVLKPGVVLVVLIRSGNAAPIRQQERAILLEARSHATASDAAGARSDETATAFVSV